ncbi:MAG TPA: hypothetical protein VG206_19035 [Terriglobia bacterium]|nr:hypothetical protein [Terriglobia bacterium]
MPRLFVNAVRVDRYAPVVSGLYPATNALIGDFGSMLSGIDLPTPGCWEITGRYGSDSLSFVVFVKP